MEGIFPLSKYLKFSNVNIFGTVFLIHSRFTVVILLACIVVLSTKPYFREPIKCTAGGEAKDSIYDDFCWSMGTYILVNQNGTLNKNDATHYLKDDIVNYGLGHESNSTERLHFRYYQWITLLLFQQAIFLYFPSYLWKIWEHKRLESLCTDIALTVVPDDAYYEKKSRLFNYFTTDNRFIHKSYLKKYVTCEGINFFVVCGNMWSLHLLFNGFWTNFLPALFKPETYCWENWNYLTATIFPKITKCQFLKFGFSGTLESRDLFCLLPLNILNEKIFAFLGIWYMFLNLLSISVFLVFLLSICNRNLRIHIIQRRATRLTQKEIHQLLKEQTFSDWFFLCKVSSTVGPAMFADLMTELITQAPSTNGKPQNAIKDKV